MNIKQMIAEIKTKMDQRGGLKAVYFIALGGSKAAIYPGYYALSTETKDIAVETYSSNQFIYSNPKSLDERCLCILCSLNATQETVEAVKFANEKGAITIAMTGSESTEMAKLGQYKVIYSNGANQVYSDSNQSNSLRLAFEILKQFEGYDNYDKAIKAFDEIDEIHRQALTYYTEEATKFANDYKDEEMFYVLASGPCEGTAYSMTSCHLMEMQWKNASAINSGEFFHGPFEITDEKPVIILIKSIGKTRYLDDRAEKFLKKFAKKLVILDCDKIRFDLIDDSVAEYFSSVVMLPIERFFVYKMSIMRKHDMDTRRYMWQFKY